MNLTVAERQDISTIRALLSFEFNTWIRFLDRPSEEEVFLRPGEVRLRAYLAQHSLERWGDVVNNLANAHLHLRCLFAAGLGWPVAKFDEASVPVMLELGADRDRLETYLPADIGELDVSILHPINALVHMLEPLSVFMAVRLNAWSRGAQQDIGQSSMAERTMVTNTAHGYKILCSPAYCVSVQAGSFEGLSSPAIGSIEPGTYRFGVYKTNALWHSEVFKVPCGEAIHVPKP